MNKKRRLPPARMGPQPLDGLRLDSYTVGSWCDNQTGENPVAVGLSVRVAGLLGDRGQYIDLVLRLKTPEAVDTLIQALLRHKRDVWPDAS